MYVQISVLAKLAVKCYMCFLTMMMWQPCVTNISLPANITAAPLKLRPYGAIQMSILYYYYYYQGPRSLDDKKYTAITTFIHLYI